MKDNYWVIEMSDIPPENKRIANEYLMKLKLDGKGKNTIDKYRRILQKFFRECPKPLKELTPDDVMSWLTTNYGHKKERTIELNLSALASFFNYCIGEGFIEIMLVKKHWWPKIPRSIPRYLDGDEIARLKVQIENIPIRNRAIIEFLLSSGCRSCELCGLNVDDIDLINRTAQVVGKGGKPREIHFSKGCAFLLKEYLKVRPNKDKAFFISKHGKRLTEGGLYLILAKVRAMAGLSGFSPRSLRHTFATMMLSKGADLDFIRHELGHNDLNTTRIYANIPSSELKYSYAKYME